MPKFVEPRDVASVDDCFFYHSIEIPDHGFIEGASDMRPAIPVMIDPVDFRDKEVVEIGPAGGFLTFEMEKRGARVVSVELGPESDWDYIEHSGQPLAEKRENFQRHLRQLRNGYWFAHRKFGSTAQVVHGTVYELAQLGVSGQIGVLTNVLVHLRDPIKALESLTKLVSETLIICDAEPYTESRRLAPLRFLSRKYPIAQFFGNHLDKKNDNTWWHLSPRIVEEYVRICGFTQTQVVFFKSGLKKGAVYQWALIAKRPCKLA